VDGLTSAIQSVPPVAAYAIIAALVFGEAAIFIGFVLPGETAVLLGGFLASTNHLNIWVLCALVFVSAVVGDTVGYEVGRKFGPRIVRSRFFVKHESRLEAARGILRRRGGPAVFLGRFTAFFRAVMPGLAGLSEMRYPLFLAWNALGGLAWGVGFSLIGYFAGASYETVAKKVGTGSAIALGVVVLIALAVWMVRRHRRQAGDEATAPSPSSAAPNEAHNELL
jgi:membrane protein DedA with SNARE-associated domain